MTLSTVNTLKCSLTLLHNLKCVYRSQAGKIQTLFKEIERFVKSLDSVGNTFTWIAQLEHGLGNLSIDQIMHEIYQWQVAKNSCIFFLALLIIVNIDVTMQNFYAGNCLGIHMSSKI